ncbi:hypothetical protein C8J57DRAFT_124474 [Mycena rebaudengoi]|nr:hypothetical protein C8J57DRAFT_124474 [Mycena rebaudengoi]
MPPSQTSPTQVLVDFLLKAAPPGVTDPPALPPSLNNLPSEVYIEAALQYIDVYPFRQSFTVHTPKKAQPETLKPDSTWKDKSRAVLKACIAADRASLAPLSSGGPYDASRGKLDFVHQHIINRRWTLEEVASEMRALLQLMRSRTRMPSSVSTPMDTDLPRKKSVVTQVRARDDKCRFTGVEPDKEGEEGEDQVRRAAVVDTLQVVYCLPFKTGNTSFDLIEALVGTKFTDWEADSVQNAFLARVGIHQLFGAFKLFLEWTEDNQIIIRGRTGSASPNKYLGSLLNDRGEHSNSILNQPLRPRHDSSIPDLDRKFFIVHKYIGDILYMSGGAEPVSDDEELEDDEDDVKVVSLTNLADIFEMLNSPNMEFLPREKQGIFLPSIQLVHKDEVWATRRDSSASEGARQQP